MQLNLTNNLVNGNGDEEAHVIRNTISNAYLFPLISCLMAIARQRNHSRLTSIENLVAIANMNVFFSAGGVYPVAANLMPAQKQLWGAGQDGAQNEPHKEPGTEIRLAH